MSYFSRSGFLGLLTGNISVNSINAGQPNSGPVSGKTTSVSGAPVKPGLDPYTGTLDNAQLMHLIRRTLFGGTLKDYKYFSGKTLQQCLDILLTQAPPLSPPVNTYNNANFTDPDVPFGNTWVYAQFGDPAGDQDGLRFYNLKAWWAGQMINQDLSLTEKMTIFWTNHLAAQMYLMKDARKAYSYFAALRPHALGNFKKLVKEITINPGMLEYLNGNVNTSAAPNENYARELQELFTVGKGPGSHYNEADVKQAARVLTGWETKEGPGGVTSAFNPVKHDTGNKQFSIFYGNKVINGNEGQDGAKETDELIDMIFAEREVARYFCRNVFRWFVYYKIDASIESDIIEPLADILVKNDFEIKPVLRALLGSAYFFDPINMGCQIKNPIDHLIGACRQLCYPDYSNDVKNQYLEWSHLAYRLQIGAMDPGDPPNVSGWPAYYQIPAYTENWINATTLTQRNSLTDFLVQQHFDLLAFTNQLSCPSDVNDLIAESCGVLCAVPFDQSQTAVMKKILLSGQTQEHYWTDAWLEYVADPNQFTKSVVLNRLIPYYSHLLQRSEYQLA